MPRDAGLRPRYLDEVRQGTRRDMGGGFTVDRGFIAKPSSDKEKAKCGAVRYVIQFTAGTI